MKTRHALLAFGANLGDRHAQWRDALRLLSGSDLSIGQTSTLYETVPVGGPAGQEPFLNAALTVVTSLSPAELIDRLLSVEKNIGRIRESRWGARLVDLDLLLYDQYVLDAPKSIVPHPRMTFRRFMLEPAVEVAADWQHPVTECSLRQLLSILDRKPRSAKIVLNCTNSQVSDGSDLETPKQACDLGEANGPIAHLVQLLEQADFAVQLARPAKADCIPIGPTDPATLTIFISHLLHPKLGQVNGPYLMLNPDQVGQWEIEITAAIAAIE